MTTQSNEQTEAFPRSTMEILEQLRDVHSAELEKASSALDALSDDEKIAKRYDKAEEKVAGCRELLRKMEPSSGSVLAAAIDRLGAENVSVSFAATVDTDTGEVTEYDPGTTAICPDCGGAPRHPPRRRLLRRRLPPRPPGRTCGRAGAGAVGSGQPAVWRLRMSVHASAAKPMEEAAMPASATLNDSYPGATPAGTRVPVLGRSGTSVFIKVGKKTVKCSPKWLDMDAAPVLVRRRLRIGGFLER